MKYLYLYLYIILTYPLTGIFILVNFKKFRGYLKENFIFQAISFGGKAALQNDSVKKKLKSPGAFVIMFLLAIILIISIPIITPVLIIDILLDLFRFFFPKKKKQAPEGLTVFINDEREFTDGPEYIIENENTMENK